MNSPLSDFVTFFAGTGRFYLTLMLFSALVLALWPDRKTGARTITGKVTAIIFAGILLGAIAANLAVDNQWFTEVEALIAALLFPAAMLALICTFFSTGSPSRYSSWGALPLLGLVGANGSFDFLVFIHDKALSVTSVVNTALILKSGAVILGFAALAGLCYLLTFFGRRFSHGSLRSLLALLIIFEALQWMATLLIDLIRLEMLGATPAIISFVAKVQNIAHLWVYLLLAFSLVLWALFLPRRHRGVQNNTENIAEPQRRKLTACKLVDQRRIVVAITLIALFTSLQGWHDLVISQPPNLSEAVPVTADEHGMIHIPVEGLKDGHLHRFSYITSNGHRVRFFIIQRYDNSNKFGVVYDACELCADTGYIERERNVICLACNVSIFIPSIGKEGGCNPIPMVHERTDEAIVITAKELESASMLFSERVEIVAKDPVTQAEVSNLKSQYSYTVDGFTYYFETMETLEQFKDAPEKYLSGSRSI